MVDGTVAKWWLSKWTAGLFLVIFSSLDTLSTGALGMGPVSPKVKLPDFSPSTVSSTLLFTIFLQPRYSAGLETTPQRSSIFLHQEIIVSTKRRHQEANNIRLRQALTLLSIG